MTEFIREISIRQILRRLAKIRANILGGRTHGTEERLRNYF